MAKFSLDHKWVQMLRTVGVDEAEVLRLAGLPSDLFEQQGAALSTDEFFRFWASLASCVDDPAFPIQMVENLSTEMFDPLLFAAYCSPNFDVALQRLSKFKPLVCPMRLDIDRSPTKTAVYPVFVDAESSPPPALVILELVFFVQLLRMGTRQPIQPLQVLSPIKLDAEDRLQQFFGVKPKLANAIGLVFSASDTSLPFATVNSKMWDFFEPGLQQRLSELSGEASVAERVRAVLMERLPAGESAMEAVASRLSMSKRTLQRRLGQEQTTYQTELGKVRERLARHYLENTDLSGRQISFLLGFDDPNSFFRAFQAWTGSTPAMVRSESRV